MLESFEWPDVEEEADEIIIRNIRQHGCNVTGIPSSKDEPEYAFSIGLFVNYGQAEILIFGLDPKVATTLINDVRDHAAAGRRFIAGDVSDEILVDHRVCFVEVPLQLYAKYLGTAIWFYRKSPRPFPCLQLVWPDRDDRFPWETGHDAILKKYQPILKSFS
jgi:hypothetical protein